MRQRDYKDRTTVSLSIERDVKKEIEQIAGSESFSSFVNRVLEEEIERRSQRRAKSSKKVNGLDAIGVALALNGLGQSNNNHRLVNILRDFPTTTDVYKKCKEDNITLDEWIECNRIANVIAVGLNNFRPNIGRELKA